MAQLEVDFSKLSVAALPTEVTSAVGSRLLVDMNHWAHCFRVPSFEVSSDDMSRAASMLVTCSGRATTNERVCALLGWLVVTSEDLGVSGRELLAMLADVVKLRQTVDPRKLDG
jgi:hypothetical protein